MYIHSLCVGWYFYCKQDLVDIIIYEWVDIHHICKYLLCVVFRLSRYVTGINRRYFRCNGVMVVLRVGKEHVAMEGVLMFMDGVLMFMEGVLIVVGGCVVGVLLVCWRVC